MGPGTVARIRPTLAPERLEAPEMQGTRSLPRLKATCRTARSGRTG